jgi:hypothetical protein
MIWPRASLNDAIAGVGNVSASGMCHQGDQESQEQEVVATQCDQGLGSKELGPFRFHLPETPLLTSVKSCLPVRNDRTPKPSLRRQENCAQCRENSGLPTELSRQRSFRWHHIWAVEAGKVRRLPARGEDGDFVEGALIVRRARRVLRLSDSQSFSAIVLSL